VVGEKIAMKIAILGSGKGTAFAPLIEAQKQNRLQGDLSLVLSDKEKAGILNLAKITNIPHHFVNPQGLERKVYDEHLHQHLLNAEIDLIVLIGFMRILHINFIKHWPHKIINVHPSLLPKHAGLMNLAVHQAVLNNKETLTGCTVHYVTEQVDAGPVILQKRCAVLTKDTVQDLKNRVQALEAPALLQAINTIYQQDFS
jgi:phosphoribosylglycinamide formyltransferase 1